MITRISVDLNGTALSSLSEAIILQRVEEPSPNWNVTAVSRGTQDGQRWTGTEKRFRDVIIVFAINIMRDVQQREAVLQKVRDWAANGGDLRISSRPGQRLRVICQAMPAVKGIDKWAESYQMTLRAYEVPEWELISPDSATISAGTSGSATLTVLGSAGGKLCAEATNGSGSTCNAASVSANGEAITFSSMGLADGETLVIDYDEKDVQRIRIKNASNVYRSALAKRTTASSDDIHLKAGANTVSVTSGAALSWRIYTYGRMNG